MTRKPASRQNGGFLTRLNALETVVLAIIALVALAGLMLVGKGFYLKAMAGLSGDAMSGGRAVDEAVVTIASPGIEAPAS